MSDRVLTGPERNSVVLTVQQWRSRLRRAFVIEERRVLVFGEYVQPQITTHDDVVEEILCVLDKLYAALENVWSQSQFQLKPFFDREEGVLTVGRWGQKLVYDLTNQVADLLSIKVGSIDVVVNINKAKVPFVDETVDTCDLEKLVEFIEEFDQFVEEKGLKARSKVALSILELSEHRIPYEEDEVQLVE